MLLLISLKNIFCFNILISSSPSTRRWQMRERIAIIDGIRTPMAPAGKGLKDIQADDLGTFAWEGFKDSFDYIIFEDAFQA